MGNDVSGLAPRDKMRAALEGIMRTDTFWAVPLSSVGYVEDASISTMYIGIKSEEITIGYSPEFVSRESLQIIEFGLIHEQLHRELRHHLRRDGRDFETWNQACDYEIHSILNKLRAIPSWALYDPKFDGLDCTEIYNVLWGKKKEQEDNQKQDENLNSDNSDSNETSGSSSTSGSEQNKNDSNSDNEAQGSESGEGEGEGEDSGSSEGEAQPGEGRGSGKGSNDSSYFGEVRDFEGEGGGAPNENDIRKESERIDISTQQSAQLARKAGNMPGSLEAVVDYVTAGELDWRTVLANWINEMARTDYSWARPSRRYASLGIPMPSLNRKELGKIAIMLDTSGSVLCRPEMVREIVGEVQSLFDTFNITSCLFIPCDTRVIKEGVQELGPNDEVDLSMLHGGGGTSFIPPFQYLEDEQEEDIVGAIYLTDGECNSFPTIEPDYNVLWFIAKGGMFSFQPPFGEVIGIK